MGSFNIKPDNFTLATVSKVNGEIKDLVAGKLVHFKSIKTGFVLDIVVSNSLISMYGKRGVFEEMKNVFDEMCERNVGSWNALISGYSNSGDWRLVKDLWEVVKNMQLDGMKLNGFTISSLLSLSGSDAVKFRWNVFDRMILRNVYAWTSMINGYIENGDFDEALILFQKMQLNDGIEPNKE
ncbi:hypothetical protein GQ457_06G016610 [Hibiscus cannabinus]